MMEYDKEITIKQLINLVEVAKNTHKKSEGETSGKYLDALITPKICIPKVFFFPLFHFSFLFFFSYLTSFFFFNR